MLLAQKIFNDPGMAPSQHGIDATHSQVQTVVCLVPIGTTEVTQPGVLRINSAISEIFLSLEMFFESRTPHPSTS